MVTNFDLKGSAKLEHLQYVHPVLMTIMAHLSLMLKQSGKKLVVTSIIRDKDNFSRSTTHQTGRAFDFSIENITKLEQKLILNELNRKFYKYGALVGGKGDDSVSDKEKVKFGRRRLLLYHDIGMGHHGHVQISRKYSVKIDHKQLQKTG